MLSLHKLQLTGPAGAVKISVTEANLLQAFALAPGARLGFLQVAECMGLAFAQDQKTNMQVRIVRLRKKMHDAGAHGAVIESIRNFGYQLFEAVEVHKA